MWLSWANAFKQLFNFTSAPTQQGLHSEVPSGAPSPPATGQATGFEESSTPLSTTTSSSPPIPPDHPSPSSHHPTFWSLQKVKASIEELEKMFGCLHAKAGKELSKREYEDEGFLEEFRSRLLLLPVRKATLHVRFFDTTEKNIVEAKSTKIILAILCRFVDYRNYEILYYVVLKFCGVPLQESMKEFSKALEEFETATSVDVYLSAIPDEVDEELMNGFSEMVVKIKMPESQCTLLEIRKLNKAIIEKSSLCSHSVYVGAVSRNCVVVRFRFPSSAVGWALAAVTPDFMSTHYITEVAVDGCRLSLIQNQRVNLNKELIKLIAASVSEDVTRVVSLLNSGADIHTDHEWPCTPLYCASQRGSLQVVRLLTSRGAPLNHRDWDGWTALMVAVVYGHLDVLTELSSVDANIDIQNSYGASALMLAVWHCQYHAVVELIKAGANLDLQDMDGATAAIIATMDHSLATLRQLVRAGSDLNLHNQEGLTPLMIAARRGRTDITNILLEGKHINLDFQENDTGWSALHFSAERGYTATTEVLVKAGANPNLRDKDGNSPLMLAALNGHNEIIAELVDAGSYLDLQNKRGDSAVIRITLGQNLATLRQLVRAGSDLNLHNQEGLTALMIAARRGRTDITNILLEGKHINLDIQENKIGWSALHFSTERGNTATAESLLKAGANAQIKDKNGLTALEITQLKATEQLWSRSFYKAVVSLLKEHTGEDTPLSLDKDLRKRGDQSRKIAERIFEDLDRRLKSEDSEDESLGEEHSPARSGSCGSEG